MLSEWRPLCVCPAPCRSHCLRSPGWVHTFHIHLLMLKSLGSATIVLVPLKVERQLTQVFQLLKIVLFIFTPQIAPNSFTNLPKTVSSIENVKHLANSIPSIDFWNQAKILITTLLIPLSHLFATLLPPLLSQQSLKMNSSNIRSLKSPLSTLQGILLQLIPLRLQFSYYNF